MSTRYQEAILIQFLEKNDRCAFEYLYDHYAPGLYGIICKIVKSRDDADDVLQDSFLKIWRHIPSYDPGKGTLFTWMLNIARNTAIDRARRNVKFKAHIKWDDLPEEHYSHGAICHPDPVNLDVFWLIAGLGADKKQVIEMVYLMDHTHEETAKILGLPLGTIKSRIRLALKDLNKRVAQHGVDCY